MSEFSHPKSDFPDRRSDGDGDRSFQRRYGPSLRRLVRHMLRSQGGPAAWRPWLNDELRRLSPEGASAAGGEEVVRRLSDRLAEALLRRGSRPSEALRETLAAV
jgi:hypothetical protein